MMHICIGRDIEDILGKLATAIDRICLLHAVLHALCNFSAVQCSWAKAFQAFMCRHTNGQV